MIAMSQKSGLTLVAGFQVILIFYHYQLQPNLIRFFHYQTLPYFLCYPDEFNQVCTNLIHNAIPVISHQAILEITVFSKNNSTVVPITNSDGGVVAKISDRIFEPFFTMKGKKLWFRIGYCQKNYKNPKTIKVDSQLSKTTFSILLPLIKMK